MQSSRDHILTSHAGSLPRPDDLIAANRDREADGGNEAAFQALLKQAVAEVARRQHLIGLDCPNDGEFGKSMGQSVNYRAWSSYAYARLSGLEVGSSQPWVAPRPGEIALQQMSQRRDRVNFAAAYSDPESGVYMGPGAMSAQRPVCTGPVTYVGQEAIKADVANAQAAFTAAGVTEGFMTSVAPGSLSRLGNAYYKTNDEFMFACADAMREEYKAIVAAGLILQIDDPGIAENWDAIAPEPTVEAYRKFTKVRIEALNHALRGLPADRIRFHLCWGSWHGPHMTDLPMRDIVDLMLEVNCQAYSFEAGNVRHEHEWSVWQEVKLPDDKLMLPGVVSHATNVVEHPDLVAERLLRFTNLVGRERVIACTDCGLGGRIHPQIAWAKLEALVEGARRATSRLWK